MAWGAFALGACRPLPPEPLVGDIELRGVPSDIRDEISEGLATTETPLLFGIFPRVLEYATYDANVLARDLLRIERALRAKGYYEAKVTVARVLHEGHSVRVLIEVVLGQQVLVARIDPGLSSLPFQVMASANRARKMAEGDVLDEAALEADRARIELTLRDAGYAFSKVEAKAEVDLPTRSATVRYSIDAGKKARLGAISIVGLEEIPERPVRANLGIKQGEPYNETDLLDAQQALISLGVFSTVEVVADRSQPDTEVVPVVVRVRENLLRSLQLGGGVRFDVLRLGANLTAGWQHKNFLGGMRNL
ncbi:MAG TPA: POTRA domain-containing protein, partial [Polyangiales bacterium]|nr:POTRA domain-containing protein [Polyangiales bacterium]